ncbi:hypothetical protein [Lederbergia citrea]|uniref:Uncharacterized protein n=1 Tax=Lederbergia citrea TaxID=2833581 RepID=A0A942Z3R1_9BACI|nr:hypothetical protein [Lederbergia citrea]MBS4223843.1 hypothetical protein [Lederbergia citrea]
MYHEFQVKVPSQLLKKSENIQGFEVKGVKYHFPHNNQETVEEVYSKLKIHDENIQDITFGSYHDGYVIEVVNKYKEMIQTVLHVKWRLLLESRFLEVVGNISVHANQIELVCQPVMMSSSINDQTLFES